METADSPIIVAIEWGEMTVEVGGQRQTFKDCKLWPGGAVEWDWSLAGTRHTPGIQPADLAEILERDVEAVVLSRGMREMLGTCPETEQLLAERGIACHIAETRAAVDLFNRLARAGKRVGGLFHSTC